MTTNYRVVLSYHTIRTHQIKTAVSSRCQFSAVSCQRDKNSLDFLPYNSLRKISPPPPPPTSTRCKTLFRYSSTTVPYSTYHIYKLNIYMISNNLPHSKYASNTCNCLHTDTVSVLHHTPTTSRRSTPWPPRPLSTRRRQHHNSPEAQNCLYPQHPRPKSRTPNGSVDPPVQKPTT